MVVWCRLSKISNGFKFALVFIEEDQKVIRFTVTNTGQANRLFKLVDKLNLDVWNENRVAGTIDVHFRSVPFSQVAFMFSGIDHVVHVDNVQRLIDRAAIQNSLARQQITGNIIAENNFWQSYHPADEIISFLHNTAKQYANLSAVQQIGTTVEGSPILGIKIHSPIGGSNKPMIVYNSLQHAREWISGATTTYIINQLLTGYGKDKAITELVDQIDWFIIPIVNVDGYRYTWAPDGNRLWRKNRRQITPGCYGVDNNRNWNFVFKPSSISDACLETFAGTTGGSEPENTALSNFLVNNPQTVAYIDFHSYSQLVMWPWAYQAAPTPNAAQLTSLGQKLSQAIASVHGTKYAAGQLEEIIYPAFGSSVDYAFGVANISFPFGIELRDTGDYGFLLPPTEIIPTGQEIFAAVKAMGKFIVDNKISRT